MRPEGGWRRWSLSQERDLVTAVTRWRLGYASLRDLPDAELDRLNGVHFALEERAAAVAGHINRVFPDQLATL
jgi:hypothetical protein